MGVRRACLESVPRGGTYPSPVLQSVKKEKKKKLQARPSPNYPIIMSVINDDDDDDNNNNVSTSALQHVSTPALGIVSVWKLLVGLFLDGGGREIHVERDGERLTFCDVIRGADFIYITWRYMYLYGCISLIGIQRCHSNDLLYLKTETPHPPHAVCTCSITVTKRLCMANISPTNAWGDHEETRREDRHRTVSLMFCKA